MHPPSPIRIAAFALILLLGILVPASIGLAQEPVTVSLSAQAGFDGYCKDSHWIPLLVRVENGGQGFLGRLEVPVAGFDGRVTTYAQEVSLPTVSRKELFLYVYPQGYLDHVDLRLMDGQREVARTTLALDCSSPADRLIGILAENASPFNLLTRINPAGRRALVAQLEVSGLPDRSPALRALDTLIISGADTGGLSPAQRSALAGWIAAGGRLVVAGGPNWRKTAAGLDGLLPLLATDTVTLPERETTEGLPPTGLALADFPAGLLVATGTPVNGAEILARRDEIPLILRKSHGAGEILYLAFDPSAEPVSSWAGLEDLYIALLSKPLERPARAAGFQDWSLASQSVGALPGLELPSAWWVVGFLGAYVFAVGPLNYLLLRRSGRRELAWLSIPLLVVVFGGLTFILGSALRGDRPVLNRLAVVQVWTDAPEAQVDGLLGLFSPSREVYALEISPQFLVHTIPSGLDAQGRGGSAFLKTVEGSTRLQDLRIDVGEIRSVALEGSVPVPPISSELILQIDDRGAALRGRLANGSDLELRDAVLLVPGGSQHLGTLAPGASHEIGLGFGPDSRAGYAGEEEFGSIPLMRPAPSGAWQDLLGTGDFYSDRQTYRRYMLLNALSGWDRAGSSLGKGITLAAWTDQSLVSTSLGEQPFGTSDTSLYLFSLQPALSLSEKTLLLPPGMFVWSVLQPGSAGEASPYNTFVSPGGFSLRFTPAFPFPFSSVKSLTLRLRGQGAAGQAGIAVQMWDFQAGQWVELPDPDWGDTAIAAPQPFVGLGGEVRFHLDSRNSLGPVPLESADFILEVER